MSASIGSCIARLARPWISFAGLLANGGDDARMGMAGVGDGDAAGEIQIASAVARIQVAPFAVGHDEIGVARPDRRHVFEAGGGHEPPSPQGYRKGLRLPT